MFNHRKAVHLVADGLPALKKAIVKEYAASPRIVRSIFRPPAGFIAPGPDRLVRQDNSALDSKSNSSIMSRKLNCRRSSALRI